MRVRALLALGVLLLGCGDNQDPEGAAQLWEKIHDEDYRGFARAPGYETRKPSSAPHSDNVDIYVNDVVAAAIAASEPLSAWPALSLIVKDGFNDDGELELVAVMEKRSDGWYWAEYTDVEAGEAKYSGHPETCTGCHESGSDYVRAFSLP